MGTGAVMLVLVQFDARGCTPLKVTKLWIVPTVGPKFVPVITTLVPMGPEAGAILVMDGGGVTVKVTPLLWTPPAVTMMFPEIALDGTVTSMVFIAQFAVAMVAPLNVTVLLP